MFLLSFLQLVSTVPGRFRTFCVDRVRYFIYHVGIYNNPELEISLLITQNHFIHLGKEYRKDEQNESIMALIPKS